eukprot:1014955-Pelagomonas_calceolata.AAC.1
MPESNKLKRGVAVRLPPRPQNSRERFVISKAKSLTSVSSSDEYSACIALHGHLSETGLPSCSRAQGAGSNATGREHR